MGPCPQGKTSVSPGGETDTVDVPKHIVFRAVAKAKSVIASVKSGVDAIKSKLDSATNVPVLKQIKSVVGVAKGAMDKVQAKLSERYGAGPAKVIFWGGQAIGANPLVVPPWFIAIPGSTFLASLPLAVGAEVVLQASRGIKAGKSALGFAELPALPSGQEYLDEVYPEFFAALEPMKDELAKALAPLAGLGHDFCGGVGGKPGPCPSGGGEISKGVSALKDNPKKALAVLNSEVTWSDKNDASKAAMVDALSQAPASRLKKEWAEHETALITAQQSSRSNPTTENAEAVAEWTTKLDLIEGALAKGHGLEIDENGRWKPKPVGMCGGKGGTMGPCPEGANSQKLIKVEVIGHLAEVIANPSKESISNVLRSMPTDSYGATKQGNELRGFAGGDGTIYVWECSDKEDHGKKSTEKALTHDRVGAALGVDAPTAANRFVVTLKDGGKVRVTTYEGAAYSRDVAKWAATLVNPNDTSGHKIVMSNAESFCGGPGGTMGPCPTGVTKEPSKFTGQTVGWRERAHTDAIEKSVASSLGHEHESDSLFYDTKDKAGKNFVEVKSSLKGEKQQINAHADALLRKVDGMAEHPGATFHTVFLDERATYEGGAHKDKYSGHPLYYKRGNGRYNIKDMHPVKDRAELKKLINTPDDQLPEKAKGSLPSGDGVKKLRETAAKEDVSRKRRDAARRSKAKASGVSVYDRRT